MMSKKEKEEFEQLKNSNANLIKSNEVLSVGLMDACKETKEAVAVGVALRQDVANLTTERTTLFQALWAEQQLRKRYQWAVEGKRDPVAA